MSEMAIVSCRSTQIRGIWHGALLFLSPAVLIACDSADATNQAPLEVASTANEWMLSDSVLTKIGVAMGDRQYELHFVTSALLRPDSSLVIANAGSGELRIYSGDGSFVAAQGARGRGPGEYMYPLIRSRPERDSIVVFDQGTLRVNITGRNGEYSRSFMLVPPRVAGMAIWPQVLGRMNTGEFVVLESAELVSSVLGTARPHARLRFYSAEGSPGRELGSFSGDQVLVSSYDGNQIFTKLPFFPKLLVAVSGDVVYTFEGPAFRINAVHRDGSVRSLTHEHEIRRLSLETYSAWVETEIAPLPASAIGSTRRFYHDIYEPWVLPSVDQLLVDDRGNLWAREYSADGEASWHIFAPDLREIGEMATPSGAQVLAIANERIVLLVQDAQGVEEIHVRRIVETQVDVVQRLHHVR